MIFELDEFRDKDVIFIGKGREWESFEKFIQEHGSVKSLQSIFIEQGDPTGQTQKLKNLDFTQTIIVKTAGYPGRLVPAPYTTPTRVFFNNIRNSGAKIIGVTGTKGKTTTASMIAHMAQTAGLHTVLAGNMGKPMLDTLTDITDESVVVLELSSYQLAELEVSPHVGVITNLYKDHIDYHGSLETYWEAKRNIMRFMTNQDSLIFDPRTEMVLHWLAESEAQQRPIDPDEHIDMTKSQLIGDHNRLNYLLARTAAEQVGIDRITCLDALHSFQPVKHRLQPVRTIRGITFIDDAIASHPEAAVAGITACIREKGPVGCVMLGGQDRDYDFTELAQLVSRLSIPKLVLFPDTGAKIKTLFPDSYQPEILETRDMTEAVNWAADHVPSGSICLLSTASPSYSIWKDFEEKGNLFQQAVLNIKPEL